MARLHQGFSWLQELLYVHRPNTLRPATRQKWCGRKPGASRPSGTNSPKRPASRKWSLPASWSDWFHEDADVWRPEAWEVVRNCPHLIFQILTKRPERIADHLPTGWPFPN